MRRLAQRIVTVSERGHVNGSSGMMCSIGSRLPSLSLRTIAALHTAIPRSPIPITITSSLASSPTQSSSRGVASSSIWYSASSGMVPLQLRHQHQQLLRQHQRSLATDKPNDTTKPNDTNTNTDTNTANTTDTKNDSNSSSSAGASVDGPAESKKPPKSRDERILEMLESEDWVTWRNRPKEARTFYSTTWFIRKSMKYVVFVVLGLLFYKFVYAQDTAADSWMPQFMRGGDRTPLMQPPTDPKTRTIVFALEDVLCHPIWSRSEGYSIRKRPYFDRVINVCQPPAYELVTWSRFPQNEGNEFFEMLDPYGMHLRYRFAKDHTNYFSVLHWFWTGPKKMIKRLGRDDRRTIIVATDKRGSSHPDNTIVVHKFLDDINDKELVAVADFLEKIVRYNVQDVRPAIKSFNANPLANHFAHEEKLALDAQQRLLANYKEPAHVQPRGGRPLMGRAAPHMRQVETDDDE